MQCLNCFGSIMKEISHNMHFEDNCNCSELNCYVVGNLFVENVVELSLGLCKKYARILYPKRRNFH